MVKSRLTTLSQPLEAVKIWIAVLLLDVYVVPSIHVKLSHAIWVSVNEITAGSVMVAVSVVVQPLLSVTVTT